jgi:hypothetical protein
VLGVDYDQSWLDTCKQKGWQSNQYTTKDPKLLRIGPLYLDMTVAAFVGNVGENHNGWGPNETLFIGSVNAQRRVTLFGDPAHYVNKEIIIRVRGRSEKGTHCKPQELLIDGSALAQKMYEQQQGMCGMVIRTVVQEDFLHQVTETHKRAVEAATGVSLVDYAKLGEFISEFRKEEEKNANRYRQ